MLSQLSAARSVTTARSETAARSFPVAVVESSPQPQSRMIRKGTARRIQLHIVDAGRTFGAARATAGADRRRDHALGAVGVGAAVGRASHDRALQQRAGLLLRGRLAVGDARPGTCLRRAIRRALQNLTAGQK